MQIGNAITEKKVLDVLLQARDRGLYHAITDCGAGGFSSAVGEMGEKIGAKVDLDKAPLKYDGLSYTEIWIYRSPGAHGPGRAARQLACAAIAVRRRRTSRRRSSAISRRPGGCSCYYQGQQVADLRYDFLHDGRPPVVRQATWTVSQPTAEQPPIVAGRFDAGLAQNPVQLQRVQQGMDHPPVRSRGARRQRHQAAGRRPRTTAPATRR